ncbi:2OG-Fe(II) oxygenase [Pedobacter sp. KBS0701]|uniref:2OG-Fe(II) oxygenase n=1 Tax=unclassified Pedobacter TaxID=2628915 RepID=UPI00110F3CEA|nr:2OG-Fe(II) oxygenase [Pedobacter sp. KBS0701]QDW24226.1 2OG-Fe(II) oxygenase [Pedobacter sp. KBS0701]
MEKIFDCLIDSFIEDKVGIADGFLSVSLSDHLRENLITLFENKKLLNAGVGNDVIVNQDKLIRSDVICWLDRKHDNQYENDFFDLIDGFVAYLNCTCYTGITGYEFHYTLYEPGAFYKKHIDQFQNNGSRQYSMIMYLNAGWKTEDGGELRIYHTDEEQNIAPNSGKSVFFKSSDLAHEVLLTNKQRMSITGWLKIG